MIYSLIEEPVYGNITWKNAFSFIMAAAAIILIYLTFFFFKYITDKYKFSS
jgi:hypothetical protein